MCGIAGTFGNISSEVFLESALRGLSARGPDGHGVWHSRDGNVSLIHTRLAILDLSNAGSQPMLAHFSAEMLKEHQDAAHYMVDPPFDPAAVLVFNGEIYNYRELRLDLESLGETFAGDSDTEVLLRLLQRDGAKCLPKLAGMFAFAYWDAHRGEALLARDAFGIKPLYYRIDDGTLSFASQTKVLHRNDDISDTAALHDYFLWGSVSEPATLRCEIRQLSAGHLLRWTPAGTQIERWHHPAIGVRARAMNWPEAVTRARSALSESIRRHLVSDVPVGIFLSGGIDSTAILALTRDALGPDADIRTFSIGFDDPTFDESSLSKRTAEHFGARHTEWRMTKAEGIAEIPAYLAAIDQPSIDGFNTWCVSKLAHREGMKVVLSGLGGDEWFAGYSSFKRVPQYRMIYRLLGPLRPLAAALLKAFAIGSPWRRLAAFLQGDGGWQEAFHVQRGVFTPDEARLLTQTLKSPPPAQQKCQMDLSNDEDPRAIVSWLEVNRYMRNQLLRDSDVFSMAHSLELRVPMVDVRLAEALLAIPSDMRLRQGKHLLIAAVPEIPDWVVNQPKRGFRFPFQQWMEESFGTILESAQERSPVPLRAWYRIWAVAAAAGE